MFANVLTHAPRLRHSGLPLIKRGVTRAFSASPRLEKVVSHIILLFKRLPCVCVAGCLHILAGYNVCMSVRLRRLRLSRGALHPAFFFSPKSNEAPMIPTITAALRPAVTALPCNLIPAGAVRHG